MSRLSYRSELLSDFSVRHSVGTAKVCIFTSCAHIRHIEFFLNFSFFEFQFFWIFCQKIRCVWCVRTPGGKVHTLWAPMACRTLKSDKNSFMLLLKKLASWFSKIVISGEFHSRIRFFSMRNRFSTRIEKKNALLGTNGVLCELFWKVFKTWRSSINMKKAWRFQMSTWVTIWVKVYILGKTPTFWVSAYVLGKSYALWKKLRFWKKLTFWVKSYVFRSSMEGGIWNIQRVSFLSSHEHMLNLNIVPHVRPKSTSNSF